MTGNEPERLAEAPMGSRTRISSDAVWPLRGADGRTFAERKAQVDSSRSDAVERAGGQDDTGALVFINGRLHVVPGELFGLVKAVEDAWKGSLS